jgi:hypothetical protein
MFQSDAVANLPAIHKAVMTFLRNTVAKSRVEVRGRLDLLVAANATTVYPNCKFFRISNAAFFKTRLHPRFANQPISTVE